MTDIRIESSMVNHCPTCCICQRCMSLEGRMELPVLSGGGGAPRRFRSWSTSAPCQQTTPQTVLKLGSQKKLRPGIPETIRKLGYPG